MALKYLAEQSGRSAHSAKDIAEAYHIPPQLLAALPYVVTILAISGLFGGKAIQPAALMVPYSKEG